MQIIGYPEDRVDFVSKSGSAARRTPSWTMQSSTSTTR